MLQKCTDTANCKCPFCVDPMEGRYCLCCEAELVAQYGPETKIGFIQCDGNSYMLEASEGGKRGR